MSSLQGYVSSCTRVMIRSLDMAVVNFRTESPFDGIDRRWFFGVLHIGPVTSPIEAVRAAIVAEHKAANDAR